MGAALTRQQQSQDEQYYFPYHYLDIVPRYAYIGRTQQSYRRWVKELIAPFRGQRLLDAGCGDGRFCYDLMRENVSLTGADYSERALCFARAFCPGVKFVHADLTKAGVEGEFDVILLLEVLEHFEPRLIPDVLDHLAGCLGDDGRLIVTVPSARLKVPLKHYQHFTPETLGETLRPRFEVVAMHGHLRVGVRFAVYSLLLRGDFLLGALRTRFPPARAYYWLIERLLHSIERCPPDKAGRLIAVCRKAKARTPAGGCGGSP